MTAILVGRTPNGNLLVADAMVTHTNKEKSYKDFGLDDKIARLLSSKCYCSLVGDGQVLCGIKALDDWYDRQNITIDFSKTETMADALTVAAMYKKLWTKEGCCFFSVNSASVYFINQENVFMYRIFYVNKKYHIDDFRRFSKDQVILNYFLNYFGDIEILSGFVFPNNKLFNAAKKEIELFHIKRKSQAAKDPLTVVLNYDFGGRFSGVVYPKNQKGREQRYSPYAKLSEVIASESTIPRVIWKLIEDEKFNWSPEDKDNSRIVRK